MRKQLRWLVFDAAGCGMTLTYAMWTALMGWHMISLGLLLAGVIVAIVVHHDYQRLAGLMDAGVEMFHSHLAQSAEIVRQRALHKEACPLRSYNVVSAARTAGRAMPAPPCRCADEDA